MNTARIERLGHQTLVFTQNLGALALFAGNVLRTAALPPYRFHRYTNEIFDVGVRSLSIICSSGFVVGAVLGLLGYDTLVRFGAEANVGALVGLSLIKELGPVLTALLVTGRAGSAAAAEIASMVTTEQLDGLRMMSIDPVDFIVAPKAMALVTVMPLLSALFIVFALVGGYMVDVLLLGLHSGTYFSSLEAAIDFNEDVVPSFSKAIVFGALVGFISTYRGYTSVPTSAGVSAATTGTVVTASVCVLLFNYVITALWGV
ncbi:MAG: MlaE family lipid ABC transporter permease subunit [Myxococcota bacterium]